MSAAVDSSSSQYHHHHRFSSVPDTMARSGGGWPQEAPDQQRNTGYHYYQNHPAFRNQQHQGPQIPRQHETAPLPPPTSLSASSAGGSSTLAFSSPSYHHSHHYAPTSPLSRGPPYSSSRPQRPYGADYATPASPVNHTVLPQHPRWFDFRRSPQPAIDQKMSRAPRHPKRMGLRISTRGRGRALCVRRVCPCILTSRSGCRQRGMEHGLPLSREGLWGSSSQQPTPPTAGILV